MVMNNPTFEVRIAVRLDPEKRGIDYFEPFIHDKECVQNRLKHLDLKVTEVLTFMEDFLIKLSAPELEVAILNDESPASDPVVSNLFGDDFVVFIVDSKDKLIFQDFIDRLRMRYDTVIIK